MRMRMSPLCAFHGQGQGCASHARGVGLWKSKASQRTENWKWVSFAQYATGLEGGVEIERSGRCVVANAWESYR